MGTMCSIYPRPIHIDPSKEYIDWKWIKKNADTGDILLFSTNYLSSRLIECAEGVDWSHVGMVVRHRHNSRLKSNKDKLYLWEAMPGNDGNEDVLKDDHHTSGVRLVCLQTRITNARRTNKMLYRKLGGVDPQRRVEINERMILWEKSEDGKPFTHDFFSMIKAVFYSSESKNKSYVAIENKEYFCSQLVARTFIHLGLIPSKLYKPAEFAPVDFAELYDEQQKLFSAMQECGCDLKQSKHIFPLLQQHHHSDDDDEEDATFSSSSSSSSLKFKEMSE